MMRVAGAAMVVLGVVLTAYGLNSADSLNSRVTRLFTGQPTDRAMWLLIGGILSVFIGLALATHRRPRAS